MTDWIRNLSASDWIAGYAALVATFLAGLEVWKWIERGARIELRISDLSDEQLQAEKVFQAHIVNVGQFDVTVVSIQLVRRNDGMRYPFEKRPFPKEKLPYRISQHDELSFSIDEEDCFGGGIFLEVKAAHRVKPYILRLPDIGGKRF